MELAGEKCYDIFKRYYTNINMTWQLTIPYKNYTQSLHNLLVNFLSAPAK